jgi:hypothetical protein
MTSLSVLSMERLGAVRLWHCDGKISALEQLDRPRALDRAWAEAQRGLADPQLRAYLEDSVRRLDAKEPALLLTREEFLAQTADVDE